MAIDHCREPIHPCGTQSSKHICFSPLYFCIFYSSDLFSLLLFTPLATIHFFLYPSNQSIHALTPFLITPSLLRESLLASDVCAKLWVRRREGYSETWRPRFLPENSLTAEFAGRRHTIQICSRVSLRRVYRACAVNTKRVRQK